MKHLVIKQKCSLVTSAFIVSVYRSFTGPCGHLSQLGFLVLRRCVSQPFNCRYYCSMSYVAHYHLYLTLTTAWATNLPQGHFLSNVFQIFFFSPFLVSVHSHQIQGYRSHQCCIYIILTLFETIKFPAIVCSLDLFCGIVLLKKTLPPK